MFLNWGLFPLESQKSCCNTASEHPPYILILCHLELFIIWCLWLVVSAVTSHLDRHGRSCLFFDECKVVELFLSCHLFFLNTSDVTLCEEAVFQSLSSLHLSSVPLERLLENLPGRKVDLKSLERLKKACSPQQQVLQLLRLWREQNKDHDKLYRIIQGRKTTLSRFVILFFYSSLCFKACMLFL